MDSNNLENDFTNKIPLEIIAKIFTYLSPADWKQARLTCSRWSEASKYVTVLKHQEFVFNGLVYDDQVDLMFDTLETGQFNYYNLKFLDTTMDQTFEKFIEFRGDRIFSLTLDGCRFYFETLVKIMINCINLKELRFKSGIYHRDLNAFIPTVNGIQIIRKNLQLLRVHGCRLMSDLLFMVFMSVYPNVKTLELVYASLNFNREIFDEEYKNTNSYPSGVIFTYQHFYQTIVKNCDRIEYLDLTTDGYGEGSLLDDDLTTLASSMRVKLKGIRLSGHRSISSTGFKNFLHQQTDLSFLDITDCKNFDFECLQILLRRNPNLESLKMSSKKRLPESEHLESLAKSHLKELKCELKGDPVNPQAIDLSSSTSYKNDHLKSLTISKYYVFDDDMFLLSMLKIFHNLTYLNLHGVHLAEGRAISSYIFENMVHLESLILRQCTDWVDDECFRSTPGCLKNLQYLDLYCCSKLTEFALLNFHYAKLRFLSLSNCVGIDEVGIAHLAQSSPLLEYLCIDGINISDGLLLSVCQNFKRLRHLSICKRPKVGFTTIQNLVEDCPSLRIIQTEASHGFIYNYVERRLIEKRDAPYFFRTLVLRITNNACLLTL